MNEYTLKDYFNQIIIKSWTYGRLTDQEKRILKLIFDTTKSGATTKKGASIAANKIYRPFMDCLDYNPIGWREPDTEPLPF